MARKERSKSRGQDSDYDGAWKEALRLHLRELLEKYFPHVAAAIDWSHNPEWHDKELSRLLAQAGHRAGRADMLVKVRLLNGQQQWIFLHIEVQSGREAEFEARIARYNGGLFWIYKQPVVSLVIFADLDEDWRPDTYVFSLAGFEIRMQFPICKLVDRVTHEWGKEDPSLAVQIARAQIAALRTAGDPRGRYRAKWQLVRNLYNLGYNAEGLREAFRLIDWMMRLPETWSREFEQELTALEESLNMPYVTSVERIAEKRGEARGRAEGEAEGSAKVLLRVLAGLCGPLPSDIEQRVRQLPLQRLESLAEAAARFRSIQDLQAWLDSPQESAG